MAWKIAFSSLCGSFPWNIQRCFSLITSTLKVLIFFFIQVFSITFEWDFEEKKSHFKKLIYTCEIQKHKKYLCVFRNNFFFLSNNLPLFPQLEHVCVNCECQKVAKKIFIRKEKIKWKRKLFLYHRTRHFKVWQIKFGILSCGLLSFLLSFLFTSEREKKR